MVALCDGQGLDKGGPCVQGEALEGSGQGVTWSDHYAEWNAGRTASKREPLHKTAGEIQSMVLGWVAH